MRAHVAAVPERAGTARRGCLRSPVLACASAASCCAVLMWFTLGCATIIHGRHQEMQLSTDPPGATVQDKGKTIALATPAEVVLSRGSSHKLCFTKEGYRPVTVPMFQQFQARWLFLDVVTLGLGHLVDMGTGALYEIRPSTVHLVLEPIEPGQEAQAR